MQPRRAAVLIAVVGTMVSGGVAGARVERGAVKQPTYANLVGPQVVQADGFVTLRGLIGIRGSSRHITSGNVAIQSRPAGTPTWTTLNRVALKSAGTFVFRTPVGATGAQGGGNVFFRVVFAGDATHGPSSQQSTTEVVLPSAPLPPQPPPTPVPAVPVPPTVPVAIQIKPDNFVDSPQVGNWTVSGATNDLGRYVRINLPPQSACFCILKPESFEEDFVLTNSQGTGTLTIKTLETETPTGTVPVDQGGPFVQTGVWVITSPTGDYNGVTGSGTTVWNGGTVTLSLTGVMTKLG
jgi:hypothetical protein